MSLQKNTDKFIEVMSTPTSTQEDINDALGGCYGVLADSSNEELGVFMNRMLSLSELPNRERAAIGAMVCGALVEANFPSEPILQPLIDMYNGYLDKSRPLFEEFFKQKNALNVSDDNRREKEGELFDTLLNDKSVTNEEIYKATNDLNYFYLPAISIFSVSEENLVKAKEQLGEKVNYIGFYNNGCGWLSKLFGTTFNEPVVVIDIEQKKGFSGKISGIVDNYQLQHLLMGLPILNDNGSAIEEEHLNIVRGYGEQSSEAVIVNKWNMYNLELCSNPNWVDIIDDSSKSLENRDCWIWSEGTPQEISKHNEYRVILLGKSSYSRSSRVQRMFKNLKADILVEKELSEDEINSWLGLK